MESSKKNKSVEDYEMQVFLKYIQSELVNRMNFSVFLKHAKHTGRYDEEIGYSWKDIEQ